MTRGVPPWARERDPDPADVAEAVAGADALVYCTDCGLSHPATRTDAGYEMDCPNR